MQPSTKNIHQIENWLNILVNTYREFPSKNLAMVINYYIDRIITEENTQYTTLLNCQYSSMKKFWQWRSRMG